MKQNILASLLAVAVAAGWSSCEKMTLPAAETTADLSQANVLLRVAQFEQVPFADAATRAAVADLCARLNFVLYDADGARVKQVNQKYGDNDFGRAAFSVPQGSYEVVVLAHSSDGNPTLTNPLKISFSNKMGFTDTFLYYGTLQVGEQPQQTDLTLRRIVSKIRFLSDAPPPKGATEVLFNYTGGSGTFDATTGYGNVASKQTVNQDVDGTEQQFDIYTIPHDETDLVTVTVSTHAEKDGVVENFSEKTIEDIPIRQNAVTICRGNLFDNNSTTRSTVFTVSLDDGWGSDIPFNF